MNQSSIRQSNFELLRIISIFGILCLHLSGFFNQSGNPSDYLQVNIISGIFNICVTCFVLISGYFGITRKGERLFHLWCIVIFYSLLSIVIFFFSGVDLSLKDIAKSIVPTISGKYWFFSVYFILVLFAPYINQFIASLTKKQFTGLLFLLITVFYIIPTFGYFEITRDNGKGIINILIIYLIGRYLALYLEQIKTKSIYLFLLFFFFIGFSIGINQIASYIKGISFTPFSRDNSLTILFAALCIFILFSRITFTSKFINQIAKNTFAVYISEGILRTLLSNFFDVTMLYSTPLIIPFILLVALMILIICIITEYIRKGIFYKLESAIYSLLSKLVLKYGKKHIDKFF